MGGFFAGVLAAAGMVTTGVAATAAIRSADALPVVALAAGPAAAGKCMIRVLAKMARLAVPDPHPGDILCLAIRKS